MRIDIRVATPNILYFALTVDMATECNHKHEQFSSLALLWFIIEKRSTNAVWEWRKNVAVINFVVSCNIANHIEPIWYLIFAFQFEFKHNLITCHFSLQDGKSQTLETSGQLLMVSQNMLSSTTETWSRYFIIFLYTLFISKAVCETPIV